MWPFKKKPTPVQPIKLKRVCDLTIYFKGASWGHCWTEENVTDAAHPWQDFLYWFHNTDKPTYALVDDDGNETGLVRSEIKRYATQYRMVEVK